MQTFPDVQILLSPPQGISRRINSGFVISDQMGNMVGSNVSDGGSILPAQFSAINPTIVTSWAANPFNLSIDNAAYCRFFEDGTFTNGASLPRNSSVELAGFCITPRFAALDTKIGPNAGTITSGKTAFNWASSASGWVTLPALDPDVGTGIRYGGSTPYAPARSQGTLPANRGFGCNVELGILGGQTGTPSLRLVWGTVWALNLIEGKAPRVEHLASKMSTSGGATTATQTWQEVKTLAGVPPIRVRGGKYQIRVFRLAGRLCIEFNGRGFWFLDFGTETGKDGTYAKEVTWESAPLELQPGGVRVVRADFGTVKWSQPSGTPYSGSVTRQVATRTVFDPSAKTTPVVGGWKRAGTSATAVANITGQAVTYTITMRANADGIDSPFADKFTTRYSPVWVNPRPAQLDVRGAARSVSISLEMNIGAQNSEATIELDRQRLDQSFPGWQNYAKMDNPVDIFIKRGGTVYSHVFSGYVFKPVTTSSNEQSRLVHLTCRDGMVRMQKVGEVFNAIVDHRCFPLDLLFAEGVAGYQSNGGYNSDGTPKSPYAGLYYADAVKEYVRLFMGDEEADNINGNGDAKRFYPTDQPAIMGNGKDVGGYLEVAALTGQPIAAGGWILPPLFGTSPYDAVMQQMAGPDRCVFFKGWPPGYTGQKPCVIYGRLPIILRSMGLRLHELRDTGGTNPLYNTQERLLKSVSVERRPERTANRFVVVGEDEPGLAGLAPSLRIAEYNLAADEPEAAWRSWEKTLWVKEPLAYLVAESIGSTLAAEFSGVELEWPTFELHGDERIAPGHLVKAALTGPLADVGLGINNQPFRVENVEHSINFSQNSGDFTTTVRARPLTASETRGFVSLGGGGVSQDGYGEIEI